MIGRKKPAPAQKSASVSKSGFNTGLEGGTTLIAYNTRVAGDVFFEEQLYINGTIEGDISAAGADSSDSASDTGKLVVCEGGRVIGEIRAPHVIIDGTVEGDVYATKRLELAAKARVLGNVHYNLVEMQLGSVVNGQMVSLTQASDPDPEPELSAEEQAKQKMREAAGVVTGIR